jgi:hypothetical protein
MLKALLGTIPLSLYFWRSETVSGLPSDASDVVMIDGWILRREDLKKARVDAA